MCKTVSSEVNMWPSALCTACTLLRQQVRGLGLSPLVASESRFARPPRPRLPVESDVWCFCADMQRRPGIKVCAYWSIESYQGAGVLLLKVIQSYWGAKPGCPWQIKITDNSCERPSCTDLRKNVLLKYVKLPLLVHYGNPEIDCTLTVIAFESFWLELHWIWQIYVMLCLIIHWNLFFWLGKME